MTGHYIEFVDIGQAVLKEFDLPQLEPGEALIENQYSAVSAGTERANLMALPNTATYGGNFPLAPGYSSTGRVMAVGEGVTNVVEGDRVLVTWAGHRSHNIKMAESLFKIEDDAVDMMEAAFAHIACFPFLGVRRLKIELGESAMIVGQGILGVFALQIACLSGAIPVVVTDFDPARRKLALELGADGIRFNSILPAWTETERVHELMSARAETNDTSVAFETAKQAADSPLGRMAKPQELANAAVFLLSPAASYITGVMLTVDGGMYKGTL